ncbi:MAG: hypothetical protein PHR44_02275 [Candidatus Omnitrophica bacterium]|nr:hypothetical protein [Candidatus Omnitrophota bacterium]
MMKAGKSHIVFLIAAAGLALIIFYFISSITEKAQLENIEPVPSEARKIEAPRRTLIPSRPEDYGMIALSPVNSPRDQGQWDGLMMSKVSELRSGLKEGQVGAIKKAVAEDPRRSREKLKLVDSKIEEMKVVLSSDPNNEQAAERLRNLMALKSIHKAMKENFGAEKER